MTTLLVSEFKAKCLAILDRVDTEGETILVTRRGKPLAKIVPVKTREKRRRVLGALAGESTVKGDLVRADLSGDWESLA